LDILNRNSKRLNREAEDVLSYQVEFWNGEIYTASKSRHPKILKSLEYLWLSAVRFLSILGSPLSSARLSIVVMMGSPLRSLWELKRD
jgi:hypothetical protein